MCNMLGKMVEWMCGTAEGRCLLGTAMDGNVKATLECFILTYVWDVWAMSELAL